MWQFVRRLLGGGGKNRETVDPALVEQLVETASTRIKMARNYQQRLTPLAARACDIVHVLGEKLPVPLPLTIESWRHNRLLGLAFANPDRMAELAGNDERLCRWFHDHPLADSVYAILSMSHEVEIRYGMEESNGLVRHDVPQEVLVLRDHHFGRPVADSNELVRQARLRVMEELAHHAARRIQGLETERNMLEDEINTLRIALRLGGSTDPLDASAQQRQRQKRLETLQKDLNEVRRSLEPDSQLEILCSSLHNPESQLRFTETELQVNAMGIVNADDVQAASVRLVEIEMVSDHPVRRVLLPVEIPRTLVRRDSSRSSDAGLYGIHPF